MAPKYYAVYTGKIPGIYNTWKECKDQVHGFPKATYKSFSTIKQARNYLKNNGVSTRAIKSSSIESPTKFNRKNIFTDGSYKNKIAGSGVWIPDEQVGISSLVPGKQTNNTAEIYAVLLAIQYSTGPLLIYTDSLYTIDCLTGKCDIHKNTELFKKVFKAMKGRDIIFEHVYGHEKDLDPYKSAGNTKADYYADYY